ncbi:Hypothetical_protein [Hexamita inflata]|uniref:Hypothetical_protein n=1 Tax=Hexamita inflata TaxID=28002 RepID=A0AA86NMW1_9EUKA|nr:Hypothetical protein HINF_LOCUS9874 [Hexamita inflata]
MKWQKTTSNNIFLALTDVLLQNAELGCTRFTFIKIMKNFVINQQQSAPTLQQQMNKYNSGCENNLSQEQQIQLQSVIRETQKPDFEAEQYITTVPLHRCLFFKQTKKQLLHKRGITD